MQIFHLYASLGRSVSIYAKDVFVVVVVVVSEAVWPSGKALGW